VAAPTPTTDRASASPWRWALQPLSGDISARNVAEYQPAKLAAAEGHYETTAGAPLTIGGIPTGEGEMVLGIRIPKALSLLAHHDPDAVVTGLDQFQENERPNVLITHLAFQVMVGLGFAMVAIAAWYWWVAWRDPDSVPERRVLLRTLLIAAPAGFLALEAGWIVTEVGRQPWIIYQVMTTAQGVTPVDEVPVTLLGFFVVYVALGTALVVLLRALATSNAYGREPDPEEARHA
jgi:cytochrome d ubiquinol oxidase subunit I